jgi:hypothetical protein
VFKTVFKTKSIILGTCALLVVVTSAYRMSQATSAIKPVKEQAPTQQVDPAIYNRKISEQNSQQRADKILTIQKTIKSKYGIEVDVSSLNTLPDLDFNEGNSKDLKVQYYIAYGSMNTPFLYKRGSISKKSVTPLSTSIGIEYHFQPDTDVLVYANKSWHLQNAFTVQKYQNFVRAEVLTNVPELGNR